MLTLICLIFGASIGSQFGITGGVFGALLGLILANSTSASWQVPDTGLQADNTCLTDFTSFTDSEISHTGLELSDPFSDSALEEISSTDSTWINPATGLPMIGEGTSGMDIGGNIFGAGSHDHLSSAFDDAPDSILDDHL
ncbi:hypothetical protein SAMN04487869_1173 [Marinobacter sp. DSM 26671]|jgi:hypothetical protein|uniref:hypothetical protein n=1 Tax=Marinobacter sp. DSM 26671 TaxID=1761793 RepID=UPI0008F3E035|nr:hypothetical protein [Marinobacter sp. DSM 26671]SFE77113.1 hypothetical protein SAMN04487869_1173 [Marinobacter sp. DSM 26671]